MKATNDKFRTDIMDLVYNVKDYEKAKDEITKWWNEEFGDNYEVRSVDDKEPSIKTLLTHMDSEGLNKEQKDIVIVIAGLLSKIAFEQAPIGNHYEEAYKWLESVRDYAKLHKNEFTDEFWSNYVYLIARTGRKIHIMEIPVHSQSDSVKIAYCDYLHLVSQGGIKEIRRILKNVENENPNIQIKKNKTLCDLYMESPSLRNNKQIKQYAKTIIRFSNQLPEEQQQERRKEFAKYYWYIKSANFSMETKSDFYTLETEEEYEKVIEEFTDLIHKRIYEEKKVIDGLRDILSIIYFAIRNENIDHASHYITWFIASVEALDYNKSLEVPYLTFKHLSEVALAVTKKNADKPADLRKIQNKFSGVNDLFFNEESAYHWDRLDFILRKKVLATSPLGKTIFKTVEDYLNLFYEKKKYLFEE